jgi:hypothetical protein
MCEARRWRRGVLAGCGVCKSPLLRRLCCALATRCGRHRFLGVVPCVTAEPSSDQSFCSAVCHHLRAATDFHVPSSFSMCVCECGWAALSPSLCWCLRGALRKALRCKKPLRKPPPSHPTGVWVVASFFVAVVLPSATHLKTQLALLRCRHVSALACFFCMAPRNAATLTAAVVLLSNLFSLPSCTVSLNYVLVRVLLCVARSVRLVEGQTTPHSNAQALVRLSVAFFVCCGSL